MSDQVQLDHLEIHVDEIAEYCDFLVRLFRGGAWRRLNDDGVSMYRSPGGHYFEIKKRTTSVAPDRSGVCLPCLRLTDPRAHIEGLGLRIDEEATNPAGEILFFTDHEGVQWHAKSYPAEQDPNVGW